MATHSNIPAWKIQWTEEPGVLQSTGLQRVGHDVLAEQHCFDQIRTPAQNRACRYSLCAQSHQLVSILSGPPGPTGEGEGLRWADTGGGQGTSDAWNSSSNATTVGSSVRTC